jgi:hypothetical protein
LFRPFGHFLGLAWKVAACSESGLEDGGLREGPMANKDKGGKSSKKAATQDLKEKRAAKKSKKEARAKDAKNAG